MIKYQILIDNLFNLIIKKINLLLNAYSTNPFSYFITNTQTSGSLKNQIPSFKKIIKKDIQSWINHLIDEWLVPISHIKNLRINIKRIVKTI